jgi:YVTN family beta-propeller protein
VNLRHVLTGVALGLALVLAPAQAAPPAQPRAVTLAPPISTVMSSPAGNLAAHIGAQGTAVLPDGRFVTPAGHTVTTDLLPLDLAWAHDHRHLYLSSDGVNDNLADNKARERFLSVVDPTTLALRRVRDDTLSYGLVDSLDGKQLFVSEGRTGTIGVFNTATLTRTGQVTLGSKDYPWGLALHPGGRYMYAAGLRSDTLDVIDTTSKSEVKSVSTGEWPYGVLVSPDGRRAYVTNWGMFNPQGNDNPGTQIPNPPVDIPPTSGYNTPQSSSVWTYDLTDPASPTVINKTRIGRDLDGYRILSGSLPSSIALSPNGTTLAVTSSNDQLVAVLDAATGSLMRNIDLRLYPGAPKEGPTGVQPNALAWTPDGNTLFVAEGGLNAVAAVNVATGTVTGHIPTAWYPAAVQVSPDGGHLYIASAKGYGSGSGTTLGPAGSEARVAANLQKGTLQDVPLGCVDMTAATATVARDDGLVAGGPQGDTSVVPAAFGQGPSQKIKHVVFIEKENRTFDQILGDFPGAERDPSLADFGGAVTPNHHGIARTYGTGDNFYDFVVDSTGGHWVTGTGQDNEFDFKLDPTFKNGNLSGSDQLMGTAPENVPQNGFIWTNFFRAGISTRVYGEALYLTGGGPVTPALVTPDPNEPDLRAPTYGPQYNSFLAPIDPVVGYPTQIPSPTTFSDEKRADYYLNELSTRTDATMPQFSFLLLPNDHTGGSLTDESYVATNDHALGRIIDGLSKSAVWHDTAVFVVEDDTQGGEDHLDANRSLVLVASPYAKKGYVSHVHHSTYSMVKTMDLMLGAPPTSVQELSASTMADYFTGTPDNSSPYTTLARLVPNTAMPAISSDSPPELQQAGEMLANVTPGVDQDMSQALLTHLLHVSEVKLGLPQMVIASGPIVHTLVQAAPPPVGLSCPIQVPVVGSSLIGGGMPNTSTAPLSWMAMAVAVLVAVILALAPRRRRPSSAA